MKLATDPVDVWVSESVSTELCAEWMKYTIRTSLSKELCKDYLLAEKVQG